MKQDNLVCTSSFILLNNMDLQSFIQSGLLEAYVLGQCNAEERAQVERFAAEHAEVRTELASIEASLEKYAATQAITPPEWMKARILDQIDKELSVKTPSSGSGKFSLRLFQGLAFLLVAACSFLFLRQKEMGREHEQLQIQTDSLKQQLVAANQQLLIPDPINELLCDPATQHILVSDGKGLNTIVYFNARLKKMAYDPFGLPAPKPGKFYQFWAVVGGTPVSMGMLSTSICESMHTVEAPVAFAISEEDKPEGNQAPTLVLAIGKTG